MADLQELLDSINAQGYEIDTDSPKLPMINSVYRRILGERRWWFNTELFDTSLVLGTNANTLDLSSVTDLLHIDSIHLQASPGNFVELEFARSQKVLQQSASTAANDEPQFWTRANTNTVLFDCPAQADYTVVLSYVKAPNRLVDPDDELLIPDTYIDAVKWGVLKELTFRERDYDGNSMAQGEYNLILAQMRHQDGLEQRQTSQEVERTGELESVNDGLNYYG